MKAAVFNRYGGNDVVEIRDVPMPLCSSGDVLVKVHAAGVNPVDWKVRSGHAKVITGSRFPKILGNECAGEVVDPGTHSGLKTGDSVIAWPGIRRLGAFAEYACVPATSTFPVPAALSYRQAASIPIAGLTALQAVRDKGQVSYGKKVLINGASGGVGHFAVQVAKIFGAEVTGVCSGANSDLVKSLGADSVIDYHEEDFCRGSVKYDIVFDAVAKRSFPECKKILTPNGVYVSTLPSGPVILNQYITGHFTRRKAKTIWVRPGLRDLQWMIQQIQAGRIRIVIGATYTLDQTQEALAHSETGKARGKIVLNIGRQQ